MSSAPSHLLSPRAPARISHGEIAARAKERPHTFLTLDALRGIAALTVVIGHSAEIFGGAQYFEHSYLAVDFFFMLSGFVLSYAYQQRLDDGLPTSTFLTARVIRLYPLYILSTLAVFLFTLAPSLHLGLHALLHQLLLLLPALFFVPAPYRPGVLDGMAFPFNAFAWTLFYELLANTLHATLLRRRSSRTLLLIAAIAGFCLCRMIARYGSGNMGLFTRDIPFGLLRVIFSYVIGMLLFRFWARHRERHQVYPLLSVALLAATLFVPDLHRANALFDILVLLFILAPTVLLGAFSRPSGAFKPVATLLGALSYAIYILSAPTMVFTRTFWMRLFHRSAGAAAVWPDLALITTIVLIAWVAHTVYDVPVRRWLRTRLHA